MIFPTIDKVMDIAAEQRLAEDNDRQQVANMQRESQAYLDRDSTLIDQEQIIRFSRPPVPPKTAEPPQFNKPLPPSHSYYQKQELRSQGLTLLRLE